MYVFIDTTVQGIPHYLKRRIMLFLQILWQKAEKKNIKNLLFSNLLFKMENLKRDSFPSFIINPWFRQCEKT